MLYEPIRTAHTGHLPLWCPVTLVGDPPRKCLKISSERSLVSGISEPLV